MRWRRDSRSARVQRTRTVLAGTARTITLAAACLGLGAAEAHASRADVGNDRSVSPNWSGYAATSPTGSWVTFTSVNGTWKVPAATCSMKDAGASSTIFVGLGGYKSSKIEQAGTNSGCSAKGKPVYSAWFEVIPYPAYTIPKTVAPGDTITATVKILKKGHGVAQVHVHNRTQGWEFTRELSSSLADTTSAEWIVSAPASCVSFDCTQASLANFHEVGMTEISAVGNARSETLTSSRWNVVPIRLVPSNVKVPTMNPDAQTNKQGHAVSPAGANPGALSKDGSAFSVKWVAVAARGI